MLSGHERRQLRIIEHGLQVDDPELARTLAGQPAAKNSGRPIAPVLLYAFAATLLVLGIVTATFPILFLAALTAMAAACLHRNSHI